jgi:hypothetical protein
VRGLMEGRAGRARRDRVLRLGVIGGLAELPDGTRGAAPLDPVRGGSEPGSQSSSAQCLLAA